MSQQPDPTATAADHEHAELHAAIIQLRRAVLLVGLAWFFLLGYLLTA